ncbi:MAG: MerR family transcriptional regulator [Hydrogenobaculum sp.]|nr:MAG: MerR family transcriptional regulator [Hydrogenobaculum sp.]PMP89596.1 MAG: MerR family transcriptional regulator [Hydrogenobaculum sp.]
MSAERRAKAVFTIGTVAKMYKIHPQTLRLYEREGLLKPSRTEGNTRLYTEEDLEQLEFILMLARDLGVNIAGIDVILNMKKQMEEMQKGIELLIDIIKRLRTENVKQEDVDKAIVLMNGLNKGVIKITKKT